MLSMVYQLAAAFPMPLCSCRACGLQMVRATQKT